MTDDGPGIAAEDLPFVFARYYRGRLADTQDAAPVDERGLGLAIAREIADLNGWHLTVETAALLDGGIPRGTRFILSPRPL